MSNQETKHSKEPEREFLADIFPLLEEKRLKSDLIRASEFIQADQARFLVALEIVRELPQPIRDRLTWVLQIAIERWPELLTEEITRMIVSLFLDSKTDAEKRSLLNILRKVAVPDEHSGLIYQLCFDWFMDPKQAIAVRVYSLYVMANIAENHPDLAEEILKCIDQMQEGITPAIYVTYRNVKKQLEKSRKSKS